MKSQAVLIRWANAKSVSLAGNLVLGLLGMALMAGLNARADLEVGASVQIHATAEFDAPLAPHGTWVTVGSYGRCWRPSHVAVGWRPYCAGSWVWTDNGWYWASDEPWAWACYHYGRWIFDGETWVWVPAVEWAPAWVEWRVGPGHIGWAPIAPVGWAPVRVGAPSLFVFVGTAHFAGPIRPSAVIVNNPAIFKESKGFNNVSRQTRNIDGRPRQVVVNQGPPVGMIEKATGKSLKPVSVREAAARTRVPSQMAQGNKGSGERVSKDSGPGDGKEARAAGGGADRDGGKPDRGGSVDRGGGPERGMSRDSSAGEGGGRRGSFGGFGGGGGGKGGRGRGR